MDRRQRYLRARERIERLRGFYIHAAVFVLVILGLGILNAVLGPPYWAFGVLIGWGAGVGLHAGLVFGGRSHFITNWERRKLRQFMKDEQSPGSST